MFVRYSHGSELNSINDCRERLAGSIPDRREWVTFSASFTGTSGAPLPERSQAVGSVR